MNVRRAIIWSQLQARKQCNNKVACGPNPFFTYPETSIVEQAVSYAMHYPGFISVLTGWRIILVKTKPTTWQSLITATNKWGGVKWTRSTNTTFYIYAFLSRWFCFFVCHSYVNLGKRKWSKKKCPIKHYCQKRKLQRIKHRRIIKIMDYFSWVFVCLGLLFCCCFFF